MLSRDQAIEAFLTECEGTDTTDLVVLNPGVWQALQIYLSDPGVQVAEGGPVILDGKRVDATLSPPMEQAADKMAELIITGGTQAQLQDARKQYIKARNPPVDWAKDGKRDDVDVQSAGLGQHTASSSLQDKVSAVVVKAATAITKLLPRA